VLQLKKKRIAHSEKSAAEKAQRKAKIGFEIFKIF